MKRLLTDKEKILAKLIFGANKEYLDNLTIYINQNWIKYTFCCSKKTRYTKYGLTINKNIYLSFDPDFKSDIDMNILIHEITHYEQCHYYGYCCLIPRYIFECICYGQNGMYDEDDTLENEAEKNGNKAVDMKNIIIKDNLY